MPQLPTSSLGKGLGEGTGAVSESHQKCSSPTDGEVYAGVRGSRGDRDACVYSLLFRGCGGAAGAPRGKMSSSPCAQKDTEDAHGWHFCPQDFLGGEKTASWAHCGAVSDILVNRPKSPCD